MYPFAGGLVAGTGNSLMSETSIWVITVVIAVLGMAVVLARTHRARTSKAGPAHRGDVPPVAADLPCSSCGKPLVVHRSELVPLSRPEVALCVRVQPDLVGHKLAEYVCPYCEASHCFVVDGRTPVWVGANLYSPHQGGARCMDCGKPLQTPPWPAGAYDGRLNEAPSLQPDYGLVCSKCHAIVCVACTRLATRGRTKDGTFVCPRCARSPVDRSYHPG